MTLFTINEKKCQRDGICAAECPSQIIVQVDKKSIPTLIEQGEEFCIDCGHCVAVCPHGAFALATMPQALCPPLDKNLFPDERQLRHFLIARRSIRRYQEKTVPRELLADLIDTARFAHTASNKQQVHWMVFHNPGEVRKMAAMVIDYMKMMLPLAADEAAARRFRRIIRAWDKGGDRITRGAPHLIAAHSPVEGSFPSADCAIALTYLELYAFSRGLGTCWAGYFTAAANAYEPLIRLLDLPAGHQCYGAVMLGYPKHRYFRIPKRNDARVTWR